MMLTMEMVQKEPPPPKVWQVHNPNEHKAEDYMEHSSKYPCYIDIHMD